MEQMKLVDQLYNKTVDQLRPLASMCGPAAGTRKAELIQHIYETLTDPNSLKLLWGRMDSLSQKVIGAAYHNDGEFNAAGFLAQYGALPERPRSRWSWYGEPIMLDLFIYEGHLAPELMPLLADLVPAPEKFQVIGLQDAPESFFLDNQGEHPLELTRADTEQTGLHDLIAYLRLVDQGQIKISATSSRATLGSIKKIQNSLLVGDFLPLLDKFRATDTIRPFGLDVFAQEAKLVNKGRGASILKLTKLGQSFYQSRDPELLLEAFETWTQKGAFDELSRISAIKGLKAKGTRLTKPSSRREAVIEALSWCPVGVWIDIEDLYRAIKIWHFDFEVENTHYSNLFIGDREYGGLYGDSYWRTTKGLYTNALLWEYLGTIGVVDLVYTDPDSAYFDADFDYYYDDDYFSLYDGLKYFRINNLGAFLLGQADEYIPAALDLPPLFSIAADHTLTLTAPEQLTPNDQYFLEQMTTSGKKGRYRLDTSRLLTVLEGGADLAQLSEFLTTRHAGPLPSEIVTWLEKAKHSTTAFQLDGQALLVKTQSPELAEMAATDPTLRKYCTLIDRQTLVIPVSKEKPFRTRLKALAYILSG